MDLKTCKITGLIRKLQPVLWRAALLAICKSFLTSHLDYVIYDRALNKSFQNKVERVCSIYCHISNHTSYQRFLKKKKKKTYRELGLEMLKSGQGYQNSCWCFKLQKNEHCSYLFDDIIPKVLLTRISRNHNNISLFNVKHEYLQNSFFLSTVIEWNKLGNNIWNLESASAFKKQFYNFIRPSPSSMFNGHNPDGIKLLARLWVGLSHLCEQKFRHNFQDSPDPFCNCVWNIEATIYFFLYCWNYSNQRKTLFDKISDVKRSFLNQKYATVVETFLFGLNGLNDKENLLIIESRIDCIVTSERFIAALLGVHLSRSPLFLKSLIDSRSPYFMFFSRLVIPKFFMFFKFFMLCWTFIIMVILYVICFHNIFIIFHVSQNVSS